MRNVPKQYLAKYAHKNDVEKQTNVVLTAYVGLSPSIEKYYYQDGTSKDLLSLNGTIPIKFQGASYNIPVSIHLPDVFPMKAPIVYVKPTSSMAVRPSAVVDANGLVRLPYLMNWNSRTHSLGHVVQAMIHDFSTSPPVYSKPAQPPPPQPTSQPPYPNYNANPYGNTGYGQHPYGQTAAQTPYPVGGIDPSRRGSEPPKPPSYPPPYNTNGVATPHSNPNLPYPMNPPAYTQAYNPVSHPPPPATQSQPPVSSAGPQSNFGQTDPIKASLLTAITENLSRRILMAQEMAQKDLDALTNTQVQLKSNREYLEMTVSQLEQQIAVANSHVDVLNQKKRDIENAIQEVQTKAELTDIDDCIVPSCPLYKQLLNLYAEECAIEDTTYYLDKALMDSVVDVETYLKNVRALSRKQFMVRAQMQKARQVAGLKNITPH